MLTLRRFRAMAECYGADLRRWPTKAYTDALALLEAEPRARAILDAERRLDGAIETAGKRIDATFLHPGENAAAVARLRDSVALSIAARSTSQWWQWTLWPYLRWFGMASGGGLAIGAGLVIGTLYAATPEADTLLTMLQPSPLHVLAD